MSFTTTVFSELVNKYSSWDALRIFLMSAEGGKLRVLAPENDDFAIIRYTKGVSDFSVAHVPLFRSVVWNKVTNSPVSVAPFKALQGNPTANTPVRVTDFVDGTMFHAFRTETGVRIATRTSLDARGTFYSSRSFAELFDDSFKALGGTTAFLESLLVVGEFASFVLQHPEHKTVAPLAQPRVYVTYFGRCVAGADVLMTALPSEWPQRLASYAPQVFEEEKSFADSKDAFHLMRSKSTSLGFTWQGMVFQDLASGNRWRLRNSAYVAVRTLRGSEANSLERFVRLRAQGNMKKYLEHFRDESNQMWAFEQTLRQRTQELYTAYNEMNKHKTKTMKQLPYCLRPHVYALHGLYLASLPKDGTRAANVTPILKERVVAYVNDLPLDEQVKLLEGDRTPLAVVASASDPSELNVDGAHSPRLQAQVGGEVPAL
jgi:hypothetical protein